LVHFGFNIRHLVATILVIFNAYRIYRTEPKTKKWKTEKLKSEKRIC